MRQTDLPLTCDHSVAGVKHDGAAGHQAFVQIKSSRSTAQLHIVVATQQELDHFAAIQSHEFEQDIADLAFAHENSCIARCRAQHLRHRISTSLEVKLATDLAQSGFGGFDRRKQSIQLQGAHIKAGGDGGWRLVRIDANRAGHRSARDAERNGLQHQHSCMELDMNRAFVQGQLLHMPNIGCRVGHIRIHGLDLGDVQRGAGQHLARGGAGSRGIRQCLFLADADRCVVAGPLSRQSSRFGC